MEHDRGELLGDAVNIAARLEHLAPPGAICVSRAVHEQVENKIAARFEDFGRRQLRNIANPVGVFVIRPVRGAKAGRQWITGGVLRPHWQRRIGVIAGCAMAVLAFLVAIQFVGDRTPDGTAATTTSVSGIPVGPLNVAHLRELAGAQDIVLPENLKILAPSPSTSASIAKYLGAWGGENRWNGAGRHAILVVESVDNSGTALGFYAHSPAPNPNAPSRRQQPFASFVGTITDEGLRFTWGQAKYRFTVAPDDAMWGLWEAPGPQRSFGLTITLNRLR